jgi:hypothetical protein
VKFALEATVASEVGIPDLSLCPQVEGAWSKVWRSRGPRNVTPLPTVPFTLEMPFSFDSDRSATRG